MKTGRPLAEIAVELDRQRKTRRDFIAATPRLTAVVVDEADQVRLEGLPDMPPAPFTDHAHQQIADDLKIPKAYYDRMRQEAPVLLADNINHWLAAYPQERMVRTLDGRVRGFLSSKYRPLDHVDLLGAVVPAFQEIGGGIRIESAEVTERRLYIKAVLPSLEWDLAIAKREAILKAGGSTHSGEAYAMVRDGQAVQAAVTIQNSEVGEGRLVVSEGIFTLQCLNLATVEKTLSRMHVGKRHTRVNGGNGGNGDGDDLDSAWELLSDETRAADDKAFWLRVRDVVKGVFTRERFERNVRQLAGTVTDRFAKGAKVEKVVEVMATRYGLPDGTREGILKHLIEGADLTRFGLVNAVTRQAQDEVDYEHATDLERLGGRLIALPDRDWAAIAASN